MYLNNVYIENMGSIEKLQIKEKNLFLKNGNPKPIILIGKNGSGKTTMLSSITDSLLELANEAFSDILPKNGIGHNYYKISGGNNTTLNKEYGFFYLQYKNKNKPYEYIDKNGNISYENCREKTDNLLNINEKWNNEKNYKKTTNTKDDIDFYKDLLNNSYCVFPANRYELPHRINRETDKHLSNFYESRIFNGELGKPILIKSSLDNIKPRILDLLLDSRTGLIKSEDGKTYTTTQNAGLIEYLQQGINNIEEIISLILGKEISININFRGQGNSRIKIIDKKTNEDIIPSLDNLSAGESIMLGIFGTIIKYSDLADINKSIKLNDIEGIVIIDEIDLHLHIRLQKEILPKLIKKFPKIQFIISTHSPFFIYGMNKEFGNNITLINMPSGNILDDYKNFEEFNHAFKIFENLTQDYKLENENLKTKIKEQNKPIVFVEGPTDIKYIKKAYELLNKTITFDLKIVGSNSKKGTKDSNNYGLKNAEIFLKNNEDIFNKKIIILNDPEEKIIESDFGKLYVRKMKKYENILQHGIENLFNDNFMKRVIKENNKSFEYHVIGGEKTNYKIINGKKQTICDRICKNGKKEDFKNFETIIKTIQGILEDK